jgi:hypothetical protein
MEAEKAAKEAAQAEFAEVEHQRGVASVVWRMDQIFILANSSKQHPGSGCDSRAAAARLLM